MRNASRAALGDFWVGILAESAYVAFKVMISNVRQNRQDLWKIQTVTQSFFEKRLGLPRRGRLHQHLTTVK